MKKLDSFWGSTIDNAIDSAIAEAKTLSEGVEFDFNGVTVQVAGDSDPALILRDWWRGMLRPSDTFTVSPYPPAELSAEQIAEDSRLRTEQEQRAAEASAEYEKRQREKAAALETALRDAPALALKDAVAWQQAIEANTDPYGGAVIQFAGDWGRLMQMRISNGAKLADVADACSSIAALDLTGFMYGCAVGILSQVWIHGEELRRWHNLKTQIADEGERANENGGILNPALLTIGK